MNRKLLEILCCPVTHKALRAAPAELLERLNQAIAEGALLRHDGTPLTEPLGQALLTEDDRVAYPVQDDIPVLLEDEAIALAQLSQPR